MANPNNKKVAVTAGLRGASWQGERMTVPFSATPSPLTTQDGQGALGVLFSRGGERKVVFIMHPRELVVTHYLVPDALDAGWACWVQGARSIGNDLRLEHEFALYDVAAGMRYLRAQGFETIVLLGNSGGAGLFAYYNQQSLCAPQERIAKTPAGRVTRFDSADFPVADGIALVSPHPGQGILLMNAMDPSVVDELDAFSVDPALDPFSEANGFCLPPDSASYRAGFIERYRTAQRQRVARIDAHARALVERRQAARNRLKSGAGAEDRALAAHGAIFQVWRTDADLRCWDTSLDPSDRFVGSLWGSDPFVSNLGSVGFGRIVTPESWLSTWSGLSSNASLDKCAHAIEQPTLLIEYTGDNCVFPEDAEAIFAALATSNKERHRVRGNHHGQALEEGETSGQVLAGRHLQRWLQHNF
ncbi:pimeloyl-ACP methyl ester carboxylesterase [Pseudomonas sp. JUb42]|jgi:pimeloyl-ACP methyl ester carboxylesterase|uniref:alpha/beta hydrolase n=1 Tax=Pseudomonas sp. JUb42 TaxID=2940611 RepID=UPI002169ECDC|nr:alpha/beta hydrolase [Pseudomonas sp. JUb42]MCS3471995.1 pimeloyl-ACP methyl ester carboxylesterase [Pseudomonas sp. JUb42]